MVNLTLPPTHHRYLAEIKNLLRMRSRPIFITGPPRATLEQVRLFLGARRLSYCELWVPAYATRIVLHRNFTAIISAPIPFANP